MGMGAGFLNALAATWIGLFGWGAWASAAAPSCEANRFQQIVFATLGEATALSRSSFGMAVLRPADGQLLCADFVQGDQNIYPASTIKTLIAMATLEEVDAGVLRLDGTVAISQPNAAQECKAWGCSSYGPGGKVTLRKLLRDSITISNNIATNQLIDLAGKDSINALADRLGAPGLRVFRKVYDSVDPEPQITTRNRATAEAFIELYRETATGRLGILSEASRAILVQDLGDQKINGSLNRDFPKAVRFFHKTGNTSQVTGDGGWYALPDGRLVLLVGLQEFTQLGPLSGFQTLGRIGRATLDWTLALSPQ
jgi:beta-lactamase class A